MRVPTSKFSRLGFRATSARLGSILLLSLPVAFTGACGSSDGGEASSGSGAAGGAPTAECDAGTNACGPGETCQDGVCTSVSQGTGGTSGSGGEVLEGTWTPVGAPLDLLAFSYGLAIHAATPYVVVPRASKLADIYSYDSQSGGWVEALGPVGFDAADSFNVEDAALRFSSTGEPIIATEEYDGGPSTDFYAGRWVDGDWSGYGGKAVLQSNIFSTAFDLELANDSPIVLYTKQPAGKDTSHRQPVIRSWNGSKWETLSPPPLANGQQRGRAADLSVADDGTLYLAWDDKTGELSDPKPGSAVVLSKLEGASFVNLGSLSGRAGCKLVAHGGVPVVASVENSQIFVSQYDSGWSDLGMPITAPETALRDLQVNRLSSGAPVVTFAERVDSAFEIHVYAFNGTSWEAIGEKIAGTSGNDAVKPKLVSDGSTLWMTWLDTPEPSQTADGKLRAARLE